jgi:glucokinase
MRQGAWAVGVDLGGTKVEVAHVDAKGQVQRRLRRPTDVKDGPAAVRREIIDAVQELEEDTSARPAGVGVGVAGQIEARTGAVRFAPNLGWHDIPFQADLSEALGLPVVVVNDVRAAAWGEWLHGAGRGCNDLVCLFVGTGIGGGVVSGGRMLSGCSNTSAELGHLTIALDGPPCHCGNRAKGRPDAVTAEMVAQAAHEGDSLAQRLLDQAAQALIAGAISIVNAFNPCRLILGGGVIEGLPEWMDRLDEGVRQRALPAARAPLEVLPAQLRKDAGVVGAAALLLRRVAEGHRLAGHG